MAAKRSSDEHSSPVSSPKEQDIPVAITTATATATATASDKRLRTAKTTDVSPKEQAAKARKTLPAKVARLPILNPLPTHPPTKAGRVLIFGTGEQGALGLGDDNTTKYRPALVPGLGDIDPVDVAAGGSHSFAIGAAGQLWSWGTSDDFAIGRTTEENRDARVKALRKAGDDREADRLAALPLSHFPTEWSPGPCDEDSGLPPSLRIIKVACGDCISAAITDIGTLYITGTFRSAEGNISQSIHSQFSLVTALLPHTIVDVACGNNHILVLTDRGHVYAWGSGEQMQFGRRTTDRATGAKTRLLAGIRPERVPISEVTSIGAGGYHSLATTADGTLYTWGMNSFGQCGVSNTEDLRISLPTPIDPEVFAGRKVLGGEGGEKHSVVFCDDGSVWACGRSDWGQTGLPDSERKPYEERNEASGSSALRRFLPLLSLKEERVVQVSCGIDHTIVLAASGAIYCWGFAEQGATGTGQDSPSTTPVPTRLRGKSGEGPTVYRVAASAHHTMLLAARP